MTGVQPSGRVVLGAMMLIDALKAEYTPEQATAEVKEWMADSGVKTVEVTDADGVKLGVLTLGAAKRKPSVVDLDALTDWVERTHPSEIITRPSIRPAFLTKLLKDAEENGGPVDTSTGEIPPGIEMRDSERTFSRRPTSEARERMRELVRERVIPNLPALPQ